MTPSTRFATEPSVSVKDLRIAFGAHPVIDRLDLDIGRGEFLVLLGPSGCGKSTLLNAIAGLLDVADGEIWISGRNVTWAEPKDRGIGMVFQSYALYPRMSVRQNLSFGLRVARLPKREIAARVEKAAALLQLEQLLERKPAELSGGQRQRVAIGRALVRQVEVFLFDEPLSNLDAKLRNELRIEIKKLHQQLGNTMVYVTHDQVEAMTLADRIAVMKGGVVQQIGPPQEIYRRPANRFVAGFIGSPAMNFFDGELVAAPGGGLSLALEGETLDAARYDFAVPPTNGQRVVLGVRPEHVAIGPVPPGHVAGRGRIEIVEPMGADTILWTRFAGQTFTIRAGGDAAVRVGEEIAFSFDLAAASLFDATTQDRL
ncbi:ABC transporter ATP-binding protein [Aurantimonas sp. HBX-1]|uniref:ABC transporter ATP-binding protein n=1 Tax=Aurantimonas sp. HBX-1 TaxID=2906072 RepID=UPI001F362F5B|nr:ABC transporter ATP-binding protein [Aurantimonas sp. HBX-1]UIJ73135.1 ABC transporter ATP-binding protein [Aurantimonas sp. HBX-1]